MRRSAIALVAALSVAAVPAVSTTNDADALPGDDVVVIAVVDGGFSPYHLDMAAELMPQHTDGDSSNDLPLDTAPDQWLAGFPSPDTFGSYEEISLSTGSAGTPISILEDQDRGEWNGFTRTRTDGDDVNYRWLSGSKIIGAVDFSGSWLGDNNSHGAKVSSVSAGTINGTCPECLVVLVTYDSSSGARERASDWAMRQPWIDVVTNSYGYSTVLLEKVYTGSSLDVSRAAVERGQQVLYSAGNGQANAFTAPTSTYYSSQKAADWVTTVGAVHPDGQAFMGAGKHVDIASVGTGYPSMGGTTTNGTATFSGTSNATPVTAGRYARALWDVRRILEGPSRVQTDGVVAVGSPVACGEAVTDCTLADGQLTRGELQDALYGAATRTNAGMTISQFENPGPAITSAEIELLSTGWGVLFGQLDNPITGETTLDEHNRIVGPLLGTLASADVDPDTLDWMTVDSFCRQSFWGSWDQGVYTDTLPGADALFPVRTAMELTCPVAAIPFG